MQEEFRPIVGYEGLYEVSNMGRVKSCTRKVWAGRGYRIIQEHFISPIDDTHGYLCVSLWKDNKQRHPKLHKIVAEAFIPNPNNLRDVNHLDENKYNNRVDNLEWSSHKDNINYGSRNERSNNTRSKAVGQYNKQTGELIAVYKNAYAAKDFTGICECSISNCCTNKRKSAGGYIWKFI